MRKTKYSKCNGYFLPHGTPSGPSTNVSALPCGHSLPRLSFPGLGGSAAPESPHWHQLAFFPARVAGQTLVLRALEAQPREAATYQSPRTALACLCWSDPQLCLWILGERGVGVKLHQACSFNSDCTSSVSIRGQCGDRGFGNK